MSFASEPGRDDGGLPPVNVVIPDDARDLDRDVLAYRREMRAKRRRQRLLRLVGPLNRPAFGGHAAIVPLIAVCLALTLVGGALLSVATISPAEAPVTSSSSPPASARPAVATLTDLPAGTVELAGQAVPARSLTSSVIALVPADCDCGLGLQRVADQASAAGVALYFVASGTTIGQLDTLTARYGGGAAKAATDPEGVFTTAYRPNGLTVLLVFRDATAEVLRNLTADFQLGATLSYLTLDGRSLSPAPAGADHPTPA